MSVTHSSTINYLSDTYTIFSRFFVSFRQSKPFMFLVGKFEYINLDIL